MSRVGGFLLSIVLFGVAASGPMRNETAPLNESDSSGRSSQRDNATGQISGVTIEGLRIGFNGAYKVGHWTPLEVRLQSAAGEPIRGDLIVQLVDGDGILTTVRESGIVVSAGAITNARTLVKPGRPKDTIRVAFESGDEVIDRTFGEDDVPAALLATQELILEVGGNIGLA